VPDLSLHQALQLTALTGVTKTRGKESGKNDCRASEAATSSKELMTPEQALKKLVEETEGSPEVYSTMLHPGTNMCAPPLALQIAAVDALGYLAEPHDWRVQVDLILASFCVPKNTSFQNVVC
jgi:hypothetical protein